MFYVQRYAEAAVTDSLDGSDQEVIAAAGMVGIRESWAMDLFRLKYSNDHTKYKSAVDGMRVFAKNLHTKHGVDRSSAVSIAKKVLDHWLFDKCPLCMGRGHSTVDNTPMLEDQPCVKCNGTGLIDWGGHDFGRTLMDIVREAEHRAGVKLMKKIKLSLE